MGTVNIDIVNRLKFLRTHFDMSQTDFAHIIGISQGNVSEIERGKFNPSIETVISLCRYFQISADWLLLGIGDGPDKNNNHRQYPSWAEAKNDYQYSLKAERDHELNQMHYILRNLMQSNDQNLRGWTIIQFRKAFAEYYISSDEKNDM